MHAYCHGLVEVRHLFPQVGIAADKNRDDVNVIHTKDRYPGDQSLFEWIVNSAHPIENMIQMYVYQTKNLTLFVMKIRLSNEKNIVCLLKEPGPNTSDFF